MWAFTRWRTAARDQGATVLQYAILFPFILALMSLCIQGSLWYFARASALAAAQEGLRTARVQHGSNAAGQAAALAWVRDVAGGNLLAPAAHVEGGADITVTVSGRVPTFLPLLRFDVAQSATGTRERWTIP